jgi:carboxyl-terminal processing protease
VAQGSEENQPKIERPTEADLPGHLLNDAAAKKKANQTVIRPPAGKKIEDFQLSYALDLLHGKVAVAAAKAPQAR